MPAWDGRWPLGEAAALARLPPHSHVMPLLEALEDEESAYLVFPLAEEELFQVPTYLPTRGVMGGGWIDGATS